MKFYSILNCSENIGRYNFPEDIQRLFLKNFGSIQYPCVLLIRDNNWNDYSAVTSFYAYFFDSATSCFELSIVKIIQKDCEWSDTDPSYKYTIIPNEFEELNKEKFYSKGLNRFYEQLNHPVPHRFKENILIALNDIIKLGIDLNYFTEKKEYELLNLYLTSLLRFDGPEYSAPSEYYANATSMLENIKTYSKELILSDNPTGKERFLLNMIYGSIIATVESYLADAFKFNVLEKKNYFKQFLKNYQNNNKKYTLNQLGNNLDRHHDFLKDEAKRLINEINFHKVDKVKPLYEQILGIELPSTIEQFPRYVKNRHHIFHRNGKDEEGRELELKKSELESLINFTGRLIRDIECKLQAEL